MSILVIAEHDNAQLSVATLNSVTAASEIGGEIDLLVAGESCQTVAEQASKVAGGRQYLLLIIQLMVTWRRTLHLLSPK